MPTPLFWGGDSTQRRVFPQHTVAPTGQATDAPSPIATLGHAVEPVSFVPRPGKGSVHLSNFPLAFCCESLASTAFFHARFPRNWGAKRVMLTGLYESLTDVAQGGEQVPMNFETVSARSRAGREEKHFLSIQSALSTALGAHTFFNAHWNTVLVNQSVGWTSTQRKN